MLVKKIKYTDFNGVEREESFYFNLTRTEIARMELSMDGGLIQHINKIVETVDNPELVELFEKIILESFGVKSEDGRNFSKSPELRAAFQGHAAYDELFMEIASNAEAAALFIEGIIPQFEGIQPGDTKEEIKSEIEKALDTKGVHKGGTELLSG